MFFGRRTQTTAGQDASWQALLWALLLGNFVIGSGVMAVAGTLKDISQSLNVNVADTGILVSAASLGICLGAPLMAALTRDIDRRFLLSGALLWYAVLHGLQASTTSLQGLVWLRVLGVLGAALYTPQAAASVGWLAPPHLRGRAITFIFLGWSLAGVVGMPLAAWVGGTWGWRVAFNGIALLAIVAAFGVWWAVPTRTLPPPLDLRAWRNLARDRAIVLCLISSALFSGGQFMLLAFFSPIFRDRLGMSAVAVSMLFVWFGALGFLGNAWASRKIDQFGADRVVTRGLLAIALSLLLWPLGDHPVSIWLVLTPWALALVTVNSAQQARLVQLAPALGTATVALNASAMYGGQALGALTGSWLLASHHMDDMNWWALACIGVAAVLSLAASVASKGPSLLRGG